MAEINLLVIFLSLSPGLVITLGDALFDTGEAELKVGAVVTVIKIANFMKTYPTRKLLIEDFTDSFNLELSERRADGVRAARSQPAP